MHYKNHDTSTHISNISNLVPKKILIQFMQKKDKFRAIQMLLMQIPCMVVHKIRVVTLTQILLDKYFVIKIRNFIIKIRKNAVGSKYINFSKTLYSIIRADHSVGSVQNRTEKTENRIKIFSETKPNRIFLKHCIYNIFILYLIKTSVISVQNRNIR